MSESETYRLHLLCSLIMSVFNNVLCCSEIGKGVRGVCVKGERWRRGRVDKRNVEEGKR